MANAPHAHASADDEYLNPASGSGHEHTDANISMIIQFAVWLAASAIVVVMTSAKTVLVVSVVPIGFDPQRIRRAGA